MEHETLITNLKHFLNDLERYFEFFWYFRVSLKFGVFELFDLYASREKKQFPNNFLITSWRDNS
jgi:hypothetical protein